MKVTICIYYCLVRTGTSLQNHSLAQTIIVRAWMKKETVINILIQYILNISCHWFLFDRHHAALDPSFILEEIRNTLPPRRASGSLQIDCTVVQHTFYGRTKREISSGIFLLLPWNGWRRCCLVHIWIKTVRHGASNKFQAVLPTWERSPKAAYVGVK